MLRHSIFQAAGWTFLRLMTSVLLSSVSRHRSARLNLLSAAASATGMTLPAGKARPAKSNLPTSLTPSTCFTAEIIMTPPQDGHHRSPAWSNQCHWLMERSLRHGGSYAPNAPRSISSDSKEHQSRSLGNATKTERDGRNEPLWKILSAFCQIPQRLPGLNAVITNRPPGISTREASRNTCRAREMLPEKSRAWGSTTRSSSSEKKGSASPSAYTSALEQAPASGQSGRSHSATVQMCDGMRLQARKSIPGRPICKALYPKQSSTICPIFSLSQDTISRPAGVVRKSETERVLDFNSFKPFNA